VGEEGAVGAGLGGLVWSAAVLCSAAFVSPFLPGRFQTAKQEQKPKRRSKALPHSTPNPKQSAG
jgi:hypothetical protein